MVAVVKSLDMSKVRVIRAPIAKREPITLHFPIPPSTNNLFCNGANGGRFPSQAYVGWKAVAGNVITQARRPRITGPVEITITIKEPVRKRDLDNCSKAAIDLLVQCGVIEADDNTILRKITLEWGNVTGATVEIRPAPEWVTRRNFAVQP